MGQQGQQGQQGQHLGQQWQQWEQGQHELSELLQQQGERQVLLEQQLSSGHTASNHLEEASLGDSRRVSVPSRSSAATDTGSQRTWFDGHTSSASTLTPQLSPSPLSAESPSESLVWAAFVTESQPLPEIKAVDEEDSALTELTDRYLGPLSMVVVAGSPPDSSCLARSFGEHGAGGRGALELMLATDAARYDMLLQALASGQTVVVSSKLEQ
ncbi:hypothetical protein HaLaN_07258 [Haematococcus lacustris]|uniref:Uncharacterized protein n=1 Tax=Haematococcus lacustris TaxID=44745 RepID=A0A699YNL6_HAELA|nr:hypothetical protein HaLaN_07258 [Haematococcus lacustris]